ncbi:hypothetical protein [Parasitella parasitica]|uniref:RING-type E3 ubiquitin transferase n=1 Tax=Parasitella parasitica TaxID=35722 RepID=A0A0B7NE72_9FUNG|nr:hypothetical protein [Parasitella parasitica]
MKGILISALLVLLVGNLAEAGIFLKEKDPYILQGATWLYSNSTAITQVALDVPANRFIQTVAPLDNMPSPGLDGTTGVLYNRGDSCASGIVQQPVPLPFYSIDAKSTKVPKIALITKQGGSCSLVEKIRNAENEGAIGVIVYDTLTNTNVQDRSAGVPPESGLTIPAYYAEHGVGVELYHQLEKMAGVPIHKMPVNDGSNLTTRIAVRVSLMPADNVKPVAWEYTLLVMIVILGTSIFFSGKFIMHVYLWKKGQRLQSVVERHRVHDAEALPMGKPLLTVERLYEFSTRTIDSLPDEEERRKVENVLSDEKQREALKNTTAVSSAAAASKSERSFFGKKRLNRKPSLASAIIKLGAPVNNMCVVCLEAFKIGDQVRELPCHHEYHCGCIDPWLTSKSGECPLCKFDCSVDSKSETIVSDPDSLLAAAEVPGLRGMLLRPYLRFKETRRKRLGQVGDLPASTSQPRQVQSSRQSALITDTEAPHSPGLRAALRAVEAAENLEQQQQQQAEQAGQQDEQAEQQEQQQEQQQRQMEANLPIEEQQMAYAAATTGNVENNEPTANSASIIDEPLTPLYPPERPLSEDLRRESIDSRRFVVTEEEEQEATPRTSMATQEYTPTIMTSAPTASVPASDGGLLPDIDVSSISLCSIDLDNIVIDDEHQSH